jgi:hypothetical protein
MRVPLRSFFKLGLFLIVCTITASAQVVIRPGISGPSWTAGMACSQGNYVTAVPDNLHVFRAINTTPGVASGTQPVWNTASSSLTLDGGCIWREYGASGLGGIDLTANYVFSGTNQFALGLQLGPVLFANLGNRSDGTFVFCPDCQQTTPCLGLGTGAFAQRINATWICTGGGGGGGGVPGGANTGIQVNDNGVFNSFPSVLAFNKNTSTITLPDLSTWSPSGIVTPNNAVLSVDGNFGTAHFVQINQANLTGCVAIGTGQGSLPLNGGVLTACGNAWPANSGGSKSLAAMQSYSSGVGFISTSSAFSNGAVFDGLGYRFTNRYWRAETDRGTLLTMDGEDNSLHFYGPLVFPSANGLSFSYGTLGAVPLSQGSSTPVKWSSDVPGVFALNGVFGTCPSPPVNTQSSICFGPAGKIFGSYGGDAFNGLVRENNIPAAGITGTIEPSQIDQTNPGGLGGLYAPLNPVSQYNVPEWGAANVGPVTGPFNDAVDNVVTLAKPLDLGTQALTIDVPNCSSTGTTANKLVKFASSAGATCAVLASVVDTQGEMGICVARCGTTGTAVIAFRGKVSLVMDGATTVNDWVINSPSVAGNGRDTASTTCPTSGAQVIGRVLSTNAAGGTFTVQLGGCDTSGGAGGGGGSPGGSSGQIEWNNAGVLAGFTASGDFTLVPSTGIGTVTGLNGTNLAGLATGILCNTTGTGVPTVCTAIPNGDTATTQAVNSNDTKVATNAYADRVIAKPLLTGNSSVNVVRISGSDYTQTASAQTAITGLSWTLPANTAANYQFSCLIVGNEATSTTVQTFSINDVTVAPTGGIAGGWAVATNGTAFIGSKSLGSITATGSQTAVTFTPSATGANFLVHIDGMIEQPSNASTSVFQIELGVGGGTNTVTLKKDSYCTLTQN